MIEKKVMNWIIYLLLCIINKINRGSTNRKYLNESNKKLITGLNFSYKTLVGLRVTILLN